LCGFDFSGIDLSHGLFDNLILEGAWFDQCNCCRTSFVGADLYWARFYGAKLESAINKMQNVDGRGANFLDADCRHADFSGSDFGADEVGRATSFAGADLRGANFRRAKLHMTVFENAVCDKATVFPSDFNPAKAGLKHLED
jgi:uncharacterized protein YjbI with pentapeptide repeats